MKHGVATVSLDDMIKAVLTKQRVNNDRFGREAKRYAQAIIKAKAPDLPPDLRDDVFQAAFEDLIKSGPDILDGTTGKKVFARAIRDAIRVVRAENAGPGERTRTYTRETIKDGVPVREKLESVVAAEDIGRVVDKRTLESCSVAEKGGAWVDLDRLPDLWAGQAASRADDRADAERILKTAPPLVELSLRLIHIDDEPVGIVASMMGMSRFALNRQISAFRDTCRWAA